MTITVVLIHLSHVTIERVGAVVAVCADGQPLLRYLCAVGGVRWRRPRMVVGVRVMHHQPGLGVDALYGPRARVVALVTVGCVAGLAVATQRPLHFPCVRLLHFFCALQRCGQAGVHVHAAAAWGRVVFHHTTDGSVRV